MDIFNEWLGKLTMFFGKAGSEENDSTNDLRRFGEAETVKLDRYYNYWRSRIQHAASTNQILSNGWAFSTLSGLSSFEAYIRTKNDLRSFYFNRVGEIGLTLDAIAEQLGRHTIGGVMLYGYGNLFRESYFIERAITSKLFDTQRIYLIDCSLFYHIFAKSSINPLRNLLKPRQIKTILLDFLEDPASQKVLVFARDDLNPTRPVLHFFLGNTFCNTESTMLESALNTVVRPGDFVVGEYYVYPTDYFTNMSEKHVSEMARSATIELFSVPPDSVNATDVINGTNSKVTEVTFTERNTNHKMTFRSMLRREFKHTELTDGDYKLVSSEVMLDGKIRLDAFIRLSK